jgi:hypothetical protein
VNADRPLASCGAVDEPKRHRGDIQAIKELADRLDGKPVQAVETAGEVRHRYVIEAPALLTTEEWEKEYGTSETVQ